MAWVKSIFRAFCLGIYLVHLSPTIAHAENSTPSAMKRIEQTREIRCGYNIVSPYLRVDPNTKIFSGIFHDVMAEIGKNAGLKIIWAEQSGLATAFTGLSNDRYDVWCSGIWPSASRAMAAQFTRPVFYSVTMAWVRATDKKYQNLQDIILHNPKISTIDGSMEATIASSDFPKLPVISHPQLSPYDTIFQDVITKKADLTFAEASTATEFMSRNPGTLRSLGVANAVRVFGNGLAVRRDDNETAAFLNTALDELIHSGAMEKILKRYEPGSGIFVRVSAPYRSE